MIEPSQTVKYYLRALALFVFLACLCPSFLGCTPRVTEDLYLVAKVIDGDTVELSTGEKLRYIGIDTPEKKEPFYSEAKNYNRRLVEGKRIKIEFDVQKKDKYGRLLGYVYVDGLFVNVEMLKAGLAVLYTYPPNVKYADYFTLIQKKARQERVGVWSEEKELEEFYLVVKGSKRFHRPDCRSLARSKEKDLIRLDSREEALDKGFSACRHCKP